VLAIVRWMMLLRELVKKENARLAQDAGVRLAGPVRTAIEQLLSGQAPVALREP